MIQSEGRSTRWYAVVGLLGVCCGCGKAEYEQLVQQRIADLRSGRAAAAKWQTYTSDRFAYVCDVPAEPVVTGADTDQTQGETVDATVGSVAYQVFFVSGTQQQLDEAAATIRQSYQAGGYQVDGDREDANAGGYPAIRYRFVNLESGNAAQVQVFMLSDNRSCAMSVVGSQDELNERDVTRFFDSFGEG